VHASVSLGLELTMMLKEDEKGGAAFRVWAPAGTVMHRNFVPASATALILNSESHTSRRDCEFSRHPE
jgi:hypothetical protein